eukprot:Pgem_evm1s8849
MVKDNSPGLTVNKLDSSITWGGLGSCITLNSTTTCGGYGGSFRDFPSDFTAASVILFAGSCVNTFLAVCFSIAGLWWQKVNQLAISGGFFSFLFGLVGLCLFPVSFGSTYSYPFSTYDGNKTTHDVQMCSDTAYKLGNCEIGY